MAKRKKKAAKKDRLDVLLDDLISVLNGSENVGDVKIEITIRDGEGEVCVEPLRS